MYLFAEMTQILSIYDVCHINLIVVRYVVNKKGWSTSLGPVSNVSSYLFRETRFEIASKGLEWNSHDIDKNEEMGFLLSAKRQGWKKS